MPDNREFLVQLYEFLKENEVNERYADAPMEDCIAELTEYLSDIDNVKDTLKDIKEIAEAFDDDDVPSGDRERFLRTGLERDKVFAAIWAGERRNGNESADDQAFMNKLAYWCNADPDAMITAFMSSPYYAQKDNIHMKKCQRADYLLNTARKAAATVYSTAIADYERWQQNRKRERSHAR